MEIESLYFLGNVTPKRACEILSSPFGIGCEVLDRELWEPERVYPWLAKLGVKWGRLQTGWARVEKELGLYDWGWLDESVDGLLELGIQPFFNVGFSNPLYTEGGARYHPMASQQSFAAWKAFVSALAERYKTKVTHYEIWNEPNGPSFWKPDTPDPSKYVELVAGTAPLIRQRCPDAVLVGGATAGLPFDFVRATLEHGLAEHIDVFSYHPYRTVPERNYAQQISTLRRLLEKYKPDIRIWQGEVGYPSQPGSSGFSSQGEQTENVQAKVMLRRLLTDCSLDVELTCWFLIVDLHDYPKGSGNVNHKGLLRYKPVVEPKAAFRAYQYLSSLVCGEVRSRISILYGVDGDKSLTEETVWRLNRGEQESAPFLCTACLNTANGLVLAYWSKEPPADRCEPSSSHLVFWDGEGTGFDNPVLIEPISGSVYELPGTERQSEAASRVHIPRAQIFRGLPLLDYPLLIAERGAVQ